MIERLLSMAVRSLVLAAILCGGDAPLAAAQLGIPGLESGPGVAPQAVSVSAQFTVAGGSEPARLFITAEIADGWHAYSVTQAPGGPVRTKISLGADQPAKLSGDFRPTTPPDKHPEPLFNNVVVEGHSKKVVWYAPLEFAAGDPSQVALAGTVTVQACSEQSCLPPANIKFVAKLGPGIEVKEIPEAALVAVSRAPTAAIEATAGVTPATPMNMNEAAVPGGSATLPLMMLSAFAGGLLLNLMPCVLPVIGLKVFSFIKQAGESRRVAFLLNLWYSAGLLAVFLVLATAACAANLGLASTNLGWGQQFSSTTFNVVMASVVFIMALSFLGVWEIPIPGFVGSGRTQQLAAREGALGAFSKGAVTTILATPCSGPFLGSVFGYTLAQPPQITYLMFTCIGLGMASPYLVIGAFPRLVKFLPKPGAWMETFKQAMGFLLLGGVVFIFTYLKTDYLVPTFALLIGLWAGCWWIGRTPLHESAAKITRAYLGGGAVATAVGVASFMLLVPGPAVLPWEPYSSSRLAQLTSEGKTVMVDFTAGWCANCKWNLKVAINRSQVAAAVEEGNVVPLLADLTDGSDEIQQALNRLGRNAIPVLAIYPATRPTEPIILDAVVTMGQVLEALETAGPSNPSGTKLSSRGGE